MDPVHPRMNISFVYASFVFFLGSLFSGGYGEQEIREPRCDGWILRLRGWILDGVGKWV